MYTLGIDVGSASSKAVILGDDKQVVASAVIQSGTGTSGPGRVMELVFDGLDISQKDMDYIVATGYGRFAVPFANKQMSEITCHAKGIHHLIPDARTIMITPWEKKIIKDIEKGIMDSEVGITPENNGEVIRLGIPPLTEERRRLLAKQSKQEAETAKISIRNARRDAIEQLKKSIKTDGTPEDVEKDAEAEVQKVHDKYIKKVDELYAAKEKEIMTV